MKDLKATAAVLLYIVLFIPWFIISLVYMPLDKYMRSCAKYVDIE